LHDDFQHLKTNARNAPKAYTCLNTDSLVWHRI
jgi:hypothetical protein